MRRPSQIDRQKQARLLESARRMTPEERLLACVNLSRVAAEFQQAGQRHRRSRSRTTRS
jgi:hypothetical protein